MTEVDWAWAAGFFEGEGCISLDLAGKSKAAHVRQPRLTVVSTDRDVLERFVQVVGVGRIRPYNSKTKLGKKDQWKWRISRHSEIEEVLCSFYEHLGNRRREKADQVLDYILNVARPSRLPSEKIARVDPVNEVRPQLFTIEKIARLAMDAEENIEGFIREDKIAYYVFPDGILIPLWAFQFAMPDLYDLGEL